MTEDKQYHPGRVTFCCVSMRMALNARFIKQGFFWQKPEKPYWIPWRLDVTGKGYRDVSPINFCPFCGVDLNSQ